MTSAAAPGALVLGDMKDAGVENRLKALSRLLYNLYCIPTVYGTLCIRYIVYTIHCNEKLKRDEQKETSPIN